jgi:hypothetical protein
MCFYCNISFLIFCSSLFCVLQNARNNGVECSGIISMFPIQGTVILTCFIWQNNETPKLYRGNIPLQNVDAIGTHTQLCDVMLHVLTYFFYLFLLAVHRWNPRPRSCGLCCWFPRLAFGLNTLYIFRWTTELLKIFQLHHCVCHMSWCSTMTEGASMILL